MWVLLQFIFQNGPDSLNAVIMFVFSLGKGPRIAMEQAIGYMSLIAPLSCGTLTRYVHLQVWERSKFVQLSRVL